MANRRPPSQFLSEDMALRRVGSVLKPHGVDGSFVLFLDSDFPDWLATRQTLLAKTGAGLDVWHVKRMRAHRDTFIVTVDRLQNRDQAEAVRGMPLYVPEDEARRANSDPEFYFYSDLVGMAVLDDESGEMYGHIVEVSASPGQDLLKIRRESGKSFLFPFSKRLITSIDPSEKRLTVIMPEGLLDLN